MAKNLKDIKLKDLNLKDLNLKDLQITDKLKDLQLTDKLKELPIKDLPIKDKLQLKSFSEKMIQQTIQRKDSAIRVFLENEEKLDRFLLKAEEFISAVPGLGPFAESVPLLAAMLKSYVKKEYTEVPKKVIVASIAGLIYVVSPDLIPGFIDDAAVLAFVTRIASSDLEKYRQWQIDNGRR